MAFAKPLDDTLALVGARRISVSDVSARISIMPASMKARYKGDVRARRQLLVEMVKDATLIEEAKRRGLDKDPGLTRRIEYLIAREMDRVIDREFRNAAVSEAEVRAYYQQHATEFTEPVKLKLRHILLASKTEATALLKKARKHFLSLVQRHSIDQATKMIGGALGEVTGPTTRVPPPVFLAALSLRKPGEVSKPIKSPNGWHLVQLLKRREERQRTFEEVRQRIKAQLWRSRSRDRYAKWINKLKARYKVQMFPARLSKVVVASPRR